MVVGPSRGWTNYRHESDALTVYPTAAVRTGYRMINIILMVYDDVPTAPGESSPGGYPRAVPERLQYQVRGPGGLFRCRCDRRHVRELVMNGTRTASTPVVLESNASTDVFVYIVSHGAPGEIVFGSGNSLLTTDEFTALTDSMANNDRDPGHGIFRGYLFWGERCHQCYGAGYHGPYRGRQKRAFTRGVVYDMDIRQWLSDEFTSDVLRTLTGKWQYHVTVLYPAT